ncbi:hypothetical protein K432DRAFT_394296 [Lepidopterella palustris CBS 459.81]|uniref:Uncharacterized protein n=1 Tax=Lepidopterella palustris CBS 459.81 TaxID=1314670 RepID=A0A8E2JEF0_9PEZI|nr:hypothetical protein K432DRAFT_394296 [Lepidopterella palustris CBS 459.81]
MAEFTVHSASNTAINQAQARTSLRIIRTEVTPTHPYAPFAAAISGCLDVKVFLSISKNHAASGSASLSTAFFASKRNRASGTSTLACVSKERYALGAVSRASHTASVGPRKPAAKAWCWVEDEGP